jgi:hypothetical protein
MLHRECVVGRAARDHGCEVLRRVPARLGAPPVEPRIARRPSDVAGASQRAAPRQHDRPQR